MNHELIQRQLGELVAYKTTSGNREAMDACLTSIDGILAYYPFVRSDYERNGVPSVVWSTHDTKQPDILLYAHADVVPGENDLFEIRQDGDTLFGRGVDDMKFAIPAYAQAIQECMENNQGQPPCSIAIMIVMDEEVGGFDGAGYLVDSLGYRPKVVVMPDGDDNWNITVEAKGAAWLKIKTTGTSAHASEPHMGKNAIVALMQIASEIGAEYDNSLEWKTTANIGSIHGGGAPNMVPDKAEMIVDYRMTPDVTIESIMDRLQNQHPEIALELLVNKEAFAIETDNPYLLLWQKAMAKVLDEKTLAGSSLTREPGGADHHFFAKHGIPVILSKPVGGGYHSENEWISLQSLYDFVHVVSAYIELVSQK